MKESNPIAFKRLAMWPQMAMLVDIECIKGVIM